MLTYIYSLCTAFTALERRASLSEAMRLGLRNPTWRSAPSCKQETPGHSKIAQRDEASGCGSDGAIQGGAGEWVRV